MARPRAIVPVAENTFVRWMNYGEPGSGKSKLAGTSPKALILANNKDETVSMRGSTAQMWHIQDLADATEAYEYLRHEGHKEFDWLWVDNGTLFQEQNMDTIMADLVAAKPHRDKYVPDKAEYMKNQNQVGKLIRDIIHLPMNVGITAHVMNYDDEDTEDPATKMPLFQGGQGAFSQKICGYMNLVTYMGVRRAKGATERYLITEKSAQIYAKDRYMVLPRRIVNPSVPAIMAVLGDKVPGTQPVKTPATTKTTTRKKIA